MPPFADAAAPWHDFFVLLGAASATLVGLLFVAASVGANITWQRRAAMRIFLSATVVHFSGVLLACLTLVVPWRGGPAICVPITLIGLVGLAYSGHAWRGTVRDGMSRNIDLEDRIWYVAVPMLGYVVTLLAAIGLAYGASVGCGILALSLVMLLLAGIRNAWDITIWIITRPHE
jgi:hypothetical protein